MPTNFPTGVDNFTNPTANDSLNIPSHSLQHSNANDAIEAIETYVLDNPAGMVLLSDTSFVSQATLQFANVFSSTYAHYRLIYRMNANANTVTARMMNATTPTSGGTDYTFSRQYWTGTGGVANNGGSAGSSNFGIISQSASGPSTGYVDIYQPFITLPTMFNGMSQYATLGELLAARHNQSVSYDGIQLDSAAGAMTGNIHIYGYRATKP
jgi:hypothetical protein